MDLNHDYELEAKQDEAYSNIHNYENRRECDMCGEYYYTDTDCGCEICINEDNTIIKNDCEYYVCKSCLEKEIMKYGKNDWRIKKRVDRKK